jgi:glycyl-tRNA synthetase beta chain
MSHETLLVELFTEELPPKALKRLGEVFAQSIFDELKDREFLETDSVVTGFATPRRLAVTISNVREIAPDSEIVEKLMPVSIGLKDDKPTEALRKRLAKSGREKFADLWPDAEEGSDMLYRKTDGKIENLYLRSLAQGQSLAVGLQSALDEAIKALPIPKVMTYQVAQGGSLANVQFVRPVHGIVALHGEKIIALSAFGLTAGNITHGHRFQGAADIVLKHADNYESQLETDGAVIASFDKRQKEIERLLFERAEECGTTLGNREDYVALLEEVTSLVERPAVYVGQFDAEFLAVPPECLILTMKLNQKYFPLFFPDGTLSSRFLVVSNMRVDDPRAIIEGNERVVRPRLSDAKFFFEQDKKKTLESRVPGLAKVVYHAKLGTQEQRGSRLRSLADTIAVKIGADRQLAERAAELAKADLLTDMVGEFPELQGVMGRYYALHDGEPEEVATAIKQHYLPRFAGDALPTHLVAISVALADKMETLAGMFHIDQQPTGDKDPYALRRHALGVLRILIEKQVALPLKDLVYAAFHVFVNATPEAVQNNLTLFMFDRLRGILREYGFSANEVEAVVSQHPMRIDLVLEQLKAVREFTTLAEAESLAAANKRIGNILKKAEGPFGDVQSNLLIDAAERSLFDAVLSVRPLFEKQFDAGKYTEALKLLAPLKTPVDAFFDHVMVNVDDAKLRENRLALLSDLHTLMNRVADLSKLAA